ncbi:multidrug resistance-associated protein 1-like [Tropilaelaps mercedesae]|uniref:Multidrug resistance-associated protein 1-like n=1 Tax=Tropilaelaps mercedesae TaxID=418985 RepID=A0A1V9X238_9ACAR|nr:multidrug resistance-associated protein 1-like [Tropilaelaps mercedesae]
MSSKDYKKGFSSLTDESSLTKTSIDKPSSYDEFPNEVKTLITDARPNLWDRVTVGRYTREPKDRDGSTSKYDLSSATVPVTLRKVPQERGISYSLMRAFWGFIVLSSLFEIVFDALRLTPVYILSGIINFISSEEPDSAGYQLCGLVFVFAILCSIAMNLLIYTSCSGGIQIRAALLAAIYRKCLIASNESSREFSSGDLMNLMSVDVDNVYQFVTLSTLLWGGFLRILTSMAVIWYYLGPSSLAGLAVITACIPITVVLSNAIATFQNNQMAEKDKRLDALNEIFSGIKIIKMYAWEMPFINKIQNIRNKEAGYIRKYLLGQSMVSFVWYCSPFLVAAAAFGTYVFTRKDIVLADASFSWGGINPTISKISLIVESGKLIAIVGRVGSGKSSLLNAILGEMKRLEGTVDVREVPIAYVPQQAWIQNETVRQNIIFTSGFDKAWYERVIKKCCMLPDLSMFPAGDKTEIGEKGVNLSGGQKQRISMARAVYQRAKIYFLDDPLSAVDAHVSSALFENVIGPRGLLKNCTRILVTHSLSVLPFVDRIIILENGKIMHTGTYQEIMTTDIKLKNFLGDRRKDGSERQTGEPETRTSSESSYTNSRKLSGSSEHLNRTQLINFAVDETDTSRGELISDESMEIGNVKWSVYVSVLRHFGIFTATLCLIGCIAYRVADVYSTMWLSEWSNDGIELLKSRNLTEGDLKSNEANRTELLDKLAADSWARIWVYLSIGGGEALAVIIGSFALAFGCLSASSTLHSNMLWSIMRAPIAFFDATPLGRIINRFGKDIDVLDLELYLHLDGWLDSFFQVIATVLLVCIKIPFFLLIVLAISLVYFVIQKIYMTASRQFRRLQSTTRSPVLNNFAETLNGASSIRAYKVEQHFIRKCQIRIDLNQNCYFHSMATGRWAAVRIEWLSAVISCLTCSLIVLYRRQLNAGVAGLVLSYTLSVCDAVSWMVRVATDVENAVVAAERIDEYTNIDSEAPWTRKDGPILNNNWPHGGEVTLVNYSTRYRKGMELVLKDINLEIRCSEKVGIVGRTGAGKSSLTLALFRIVEPISGRIVIDEVNISE